MAEEPALRYCVLWRDPDAQPPASAVAETLGAFFAAPAHDYLVRARRCFGLVELDLDQDRAESLRVALERRGIPALALPRSLLEEPLPAQRAVAFQFFPSGVSAAGADGRPMDALAWADVMLLAAAAYKRAETRTIRTEEIDPAARALRLGLSLATGLPLGGGGKKVIEKIVASNELVFTVDLCARGRRLRVDAHDFDYSCLGARKGFDAAGNFKRLLAHLREQAPKALANRGARALLESRSLIGLGYDGLAELEAEERWLLTLLAVGQAGR